jgi:putative Holliday junction resolvase
MQMGNKKLMRIMGLDIGTHTIGIAISDELGITAQGFKTLRRESMEGDLKELAMIIHQFEIEKIVVGLPKNMNGTLGRQAEIALKWVEVLRNNIHVSVDIWDERLSTVEASKVLLEADLSRRKRKKVIDKLAAALILQGYLDQSRRTNHAPLLQE